MCNPSNESVRIFYKNLCIHRQANIVVRGNKLIHLTAMEYKLLRTFLANQNKTFSREELLSIVWGTTACQTTRTVDIHVSALRRKLGLRNELETVYLKGYALCRCPCMWCPACLEPIAPALAPAQQG